MALIFFEGFNRTFASTDPGNQWIFTAATSDATVVPEFGHASVVRSGSGSLALSNDSGPGASANTQCSAELVNFGTQANKTFYLGFAASNVATSNITTTDNNASKFLRFYNAAGTEVFRIDVDKSTSTTTGPTLGFTVKNSSGTALGTFVVSNATISGNIRSLSFGGNYDGFFGNDVWDRGLVWPYIELKITINSTAAGAIELRVGGLARQTSTSSSTIALPTISDIAKIKFCANDNYSMVIDDLYLLDTAAGLNTWLGPTVKIFSPTLGSTNTDVTTAAQQQWDDVGGFTPASYNPETDYIRTREVNKSQFYVLNSYDSLFSIQATEQVAAVMVRSIARETSLPAAYKQVYKANTAASAVDITATAVNTEAFYQSTATLLATNPATNQAWTLDNLTTAHFGIKSITRV
jgi:hypothetical protein